MKQGMIQRDRFVKQGRREKQDFTRNMASQKGVFHGSDGTGWENWMAPLGGGGGGFNFWLFKLLNKIILDKFYWNWPKILSF